MPSIVIISQLCPDKVEATMYALFAGSSNFGGNLANYGDWRLEQVLVGGALVFGMVLEAIQGTWMSGRTFDWMDVVADVVGAGSSLGVFFVIFGQRPGRIASD